MSETHGQHVTYDQLLRYAAGELTDAEAIIVKAYLTGHPTAAATVERFRNAADTLANDDSTEAPEPTIRRAKAIFKREQVQTPGLLDQITSVIAALVFDSRAEPVLAGYRGRGAAFQLSFRSEAAEIDLDAEPLETEHDSSSDSWRVIGQINAVGGPTAFDIELTRAGTDEPASQTAADEHGVFTLVARQGRYDVRLRSATCEVVLPGIELS